MGISLPNIIIILVIVLILFGAGKLPKVMGDLGKGIRNFKAGLKDDDEKSHDDIPALKQGQQEDKKES